MELVLGLEGPDRLRHTAWCRAWVDTRPLRVRRYIGTSAKEASDGAAEDEVLGPEDVGTGEDGVALSTG